MTPRVLLLGGGKMGGALLSGWRLAGLGHSYLVDPSAAAVSLAGPDVTVVSDASVIPADFTPDAVILAVKPQSADVAVPSVARFARDTMVISIMAGRTLANIAGLTGADAIVRAMPNTPAAIRQGFTAMFASPGVTAGQRGLCLALLDSIGEAAWVSAESQIDAVTATSGSGPAYVFLLAELLEAAAVEQGLPAELARKLARRTIAGSGALLAAGTDDAAIMRQAVTSPGGTTERALAVLMEPEAWPALVSKAVAAATARSRELSA